VPESNSAYEINSDGLLLRFNKSHPSFCLSFPSLEFFRDEWERWLQVYRGVNFRLLLSSLVSFSF
jgi:hypothetical protein